jgi:hypothetical protein
MGRSGHWFVGMVVGVSVAASASALRAQTVRLGVIMDGARQTLADAWTDAPRQVERAYCVRDWATGVHHVSKTPAIQDDSVFRVFEIEPADAHNAGPMSIDFSCPPGMPEVHIHTPTTCLGNDLSTCVTGGQNAYSCQPSRGDLEKLVRRGDQFAVVQCDERAFRFYYPSEYIAPTVTSGLDPTAPADSATEAMKAP